jgi:hypothetical protein
MKIIRRGENEFDLAGAHPGVSVDVESIGVVGDDGVLWWIVSDEYSETWTPGGAVEFLSEVPDEFNGLSKSFRAKSGGRSISRLTYGKVPSGFRQMTPEEGAPPKLQPGTRYVLQVAGHGFETLEFEFRQ